MKSLIFVTRTLFIVMLVLHIGTSSSAQPNKFSGFYINIQGDTIKGSFPKYRQWLNNPDSVVFRSSQNQIILNPLTCQQFHIDGYETYIAYHGKRMSNPIEFSQSDTGDSLDRYETITSFLREFVSGVNTRFYIFKDKERFNLYYSTNEAPVTELLQKVFVSENHFYHSGIYKEQLRSLFPNRATEISTTLYSETSIATFVDKENKKVNSFKTKQLQDEGFYISGGVSLNSLKFTPDASMDFSQKSYTSDPAPLLSIGYIFPFRRNFSRVFFMPQINISSIKQTSQTTTKDTSPENSTSFRSSPVVSLGIHFGYNIINNPNLQISLAPGAGLHYLAKFEKIDKSKFSAPVVTEMEELRPFIDLQALVIVKKRYMVWSAYNLATHVTIYPTVKDTFSSMQVGVGYKFW